MSDIKKRSIRCHRHSIGVLKGLKDRFSQSPEGVAICESILDTTYDFYKLECKSLRLKPKSLDEIKTIECI
jgi:hypothetical protein